MKNDRKFSNRMEINVGKGEIAHHENDNFRALARKLSSLTTELDIFIYGNTIYMYVFYLSSTSDLLSSNVSYTCKHEFRSI